MRNTRGKGDSLPYSWPRDLFFSRTISSSSFSLAFLHVRNYFSFSNSFSFYLSIFSAFFLEQYYFDGILISLNTPKLHRYFFSNFRNYVNFVLKTTFHLNYVIFVFSRSIFCNYKLAHGFSKWPKILLPYNQHFTLYSMIFKNPLEKLLYLHFRNVDN